MFQMEMTDARIKYSFGLSLLQWLCREEKKNFVISPLSLGTAFAMLSAGLRGDTKAELLNLLGSPDENKMHAMYTELLSTDGLPLKIANKYLADRNCVVHPQFDSVLRVSCLRIPILGNAILWRIIENYYIHSLRI